ncbi:Transcriptional regulator of nonfermentable carbon utilization [Yamadazyma tenuis]|uniref:Transcription activator of gluconeogenesis ERT1 n=1 Tax=Candida tenuis (strain ATCC 10573 / BCRC 21748 / CBS 615 / JCM 9827 / NBRC 10315 / NRRL Y-1498 / VKM Y-70) TaxID=590646 RepID=G3B495_CANTC|nr:uncharacterized protein CANTEDRAFT_121783 [Yamadazyma tenuis ATCC 10573]XP_006686748.1 uncharacterized protein CANTEDRAFT_121783 [Yamadazyma tenuis ATCC 10573]EGV64433.1 hypothetical protein CANTEDRAFT_121783 [Yamadazyma tenuis ATCC 10573]EGV64434.1 hypothetical protein CANTEDRAFT_121783 [Yamadazyma tenuis ATCC 10573]WEJ96455.1 Transcriptional regulator of nonfermentable carbon utilization [Yamadazyma tenuis]
MSETTTKPKRTKTSVACAHCHRSHMTCDSNRPCTRCIKRGLQDTCVDAPRKQKKYLADVPVNAYQNGSGMSQNDENGTHISSPTSMIELSQNPTTISMDSQSPNHNSSATVRSAIPSTDLLKQRSKFMSSAADMEYSTLSSIISADFLSKSSTDHTPTSVLSPAISPHVAQSLQEPTSPNTAINEAFLINNTNNSSNSDSTKATSQTRKPQNPDIYFKDAHYDSAINQYFLGPDSASSDKYTMYPEILEQVEMKRRQDPEGFYKQSLRSSISLAVGILSEDSTFTRVSDPSNAIQHYIKEPEDIYEKVNKPYSYTPGYHSLISYLRRRFNKQMLVQMVESMAKYRPSFIACTNALKEHDLIFMEQCFQRTLLTYDSIIKVSGTPAIVWRRTGEIAYVGNEFCILTGWTKEELLSHKKRFIVELLDDRSVLEYFQLFSSIAFGDFLGASMTECTLLTRNNNVKIKTRCSWTLKRDVFGIPMMIIGNFLPVL